MATAQNKPRVNLRMTATMRKKPQLFLKVPGATTRSAEKAKETPLYYSYQSKSHPFYAITKEKMKQLLCPSNFTIASSRGPTSLKGLIHTLECARFGVFLCVLLLHAQ